MNDTFLAFLSDQILPPFAAACAVAFFLAILSAFWRSLWDLTTRVGLFAFSMLPGVGLVPAAAVSPQRKMVGAVLYLLGCWLVLIVTWIILDDV